MCSGPGVCRRKICRVTPAIHQARFERPQLEPLLYFAGDRALTFDSARPRLELGAANSATESTAPGVRCLRPGGRCRARVAAGDTRRHAQSPPGGAHTCAVASHAGINELHWGPLCQLEPRDRRTRAYSCVFRVYAPCARRRTKAGCPSSTADAKWRASKRSRSSSACSPPRPSRPSDGRAKPARSRSARRTTSSR